MEQQAENKIVYLCYAFFIAACFLLLFGYQFNNGDQAEHLPDIYQRFDPALYHGDFFLTYYHQGFPIRYFWVETVYRLSVVIPLPVVCFALCYICLALSAYAWMLISLALTKNAKAPFFTVFIMLLMVNRVTVGGNDFAGNVFVASNPAMVFVSFGFLYFFRARYFLSGIFFGLATLFQALFGLQAWLIVSALLCLGFSKKNVSDIFRLASTYLLFAAPMLVPTLIRNADPGQYDMDVFYQTMYVHRCYLHYVPSLFPLKDYLNLAALLGIAVFCAWRMKKTNEAVFKMIGVVIAGCIGYWLLLEVLHVQAIGKIQWFKSTIWINAFCCVVIGDLVSRIGFLNAVPFAKWKWIFVSAAVAILVVINNAAWLPGEKLQHRYQTGNYVKTDLQQLHEWIRANTPKDAMFLYPPADDAFNCEAQRPAPVNFKALVFEPFYFAEWRERMRMYYNVDFDRLGNNPSIVQAIWNYDNILQYPEHNEAEYRIDNVKQSRIADRLGEEVHRQGDWIVTKIPSQK